MSRAILLVAAVSIMLATGAVLIHVPSPVLLASTDGSRDEASEFGKDMPCLLSGGSHSSCPTPEDGQCPEGFAQNGEEQCFPRHDDCPKGTTELEDDETGACHPGKSGEAGN